MATPETAVAAAARIPLAAIVPSKTNPRKNFDKAALDELADSIKKHDVLQPILLRPNGGKDRYELVAGERRYRAAKAAGLADIPATVRTLTDAEVLEIQVVENLQRSDLHELEEAEGYEQLLRCSHPDGKKYTAEEIAAKVGKSRSYVFGRLKLCALCPEARTAFYGGELDASRALLIARIGHHDTQRQALKDITKGVREYGPKEPMSYREAHKHILQRYMLKLTAAPFDIADAQLLPKAGDCVKCPKRTGNQADLFGDVKSADVCTDPKCFDDKRQAHYGKAVKDLEAQGKKVIAGDDAKKAFPDWDSNNDWSRDRLSERYVPMTGHAYVGHQQRPVRDLLGEDYQPIVVQHPGTGKLIEVATQQAVQAASQKTGKAAPKAMTKVAKGPKLPDVDEVLTERLAKLIHEKAPKDFGKPWLVALARQVCEHTSTRDLDAVALAWGWRTNAFKGGSYGYSRRLPPEAEKLGERDLVLLMFHIIFAIGQYTRAPVLKLFGIDEGKTRELIIEERKAAARKAREEAKAAQEKKAEKKTAPKSEGAKAPAGRRKLPPPAKKKAAKKS